MPLLKKQAINVIKFKSKVAENDPRPLIEQLTNKYPSNRSFRLCTARSDLC
jgi:hypothetical protein